LNFHNDIGGRRVEDKKVVPVPEDGKTTRFQKYRFTKSKGLRFKMNGTQKQFVKQQ